MKILTELNFVSIFFYFFITNKIKTYVLIMFID